MQWIVFYFIILFIWSGRYVKMEISSTIWIHVETDEALVNKSGSNWHAKEVRLLMTEFDFLFNILCSVL